MSARHFAFIAAIAITPISALSFTFYWPVLVWRACYRSGNQRAANRILRTNGGIPGDAQENLKESFRPSVSKLVPKQAEVRAFEGEKSMSHFFS
jgi:hypothetical protein